MSVAIPSVPQVLQDSPLHFWIKVDHALFVPLATHFDRVIHEVRIVEVEPCQFGEPHAGVEQSEDDRSIPGSPPCIGRAKVQYRLEMLWEEHWNNDFPERRGAHIPHWALSNDPLGDTPIEECPQSPEAVVDSALAQAPVLKVGKPQANGARGYVTRIGIKVMRLTEAFNGLQCLAVPLECAGGAPFDFLGEQELAEEGRVSWQTRQVGKRCIVKHPFR